MDWFIVLIVLAAAGVCYWVADDYIQRPMSYWSREQLDAAFKRHPSELAHYANRDSMSRKEWTTALKKRDAEVAAELAKRGIKQ